ncbi:hypothetical protein DAPPUDRAFT_310601 [Daphnia pulex]|uniref:Uncharacterized protein n=1 Tax=Daphnia pulex TaxID=6669 RepID=E9FU48_DAPPU|nr:hypothetical protein DAPPUDRAFT_310601 [Daphnia pulex]|eukprot:EFX89534.1 hypothetical protein DAPPUDRAFT_310601 [Daphnia pulex]
MAQSILQICKLSSKTIQNQGISICKTHSNPQQRKPAEGKARKTCQKEVGPIPSNDNLQKERHTHPQQRQPAKGKARKTCQKEVGPIPRNFNLQKERAVRLSFTFEGHGDHYIKRVMQWCRGWVRTGRVSSFSSSCNSRKA